MAARTQRACKSESHRRNCLSARRAKQHVTRASVPAKAPKSNHNWTRSEFMWGNGGKPIRSKTSSIPQPVQSTQPVHSCKQHIVTADLRTHTFKRAALCASRHVLSSPFHSASTGVSPRARGNLRGAHADYESKVAAIAQANTHLDQPCDGLLLRTRACILWGG